jgi:gluconate kinase
MANWFTRFLSRPSAPRQLQEAPKAVEDAGKPRVVKVQMTPVGTPGTTIYSGYYDEEYLETLKGRDRADEFDKMRRQDGQVKMCLGAVMNPLRRANYEIEPAGDEPDFKTHADFIDHVLIKGIPFKQFVSEAATMIIHGHSLFEVTHKVVYDHKKFGTYVGIQELGFRSQRTIERWNLDKTGKLESVTQMAYGDLESQVDIPGEFLLVFTLEKEGANYEGISLLRPAYGAWFRKALYLKLMAIGIEKTAVPTPKAKIPSGWQGNDEQYEKLVEVLSAYTSHQSNYVIYPDNVDLDFSKTEFDAESTIKGIDLEDRQMVIAFLANFLLLGQSGTGSYALSNDLSDFFLGGLEYIAELFCEKLNQELIPSLVKMKYGPQEAYPQLKASGISDKAGKEFGELLKYLSDGRYIIPDARLEKHLRKRMGLPEASDEDRRPVPASGSAAVPEGGGQFAEPGKKKALEGGDMQPIILVCGVPGSGKSFASRQVIDRFHYVPHDRCWVHPEKEGWDPATEWTADMKDETRWFQGAKSNHLETLVRAAKIAKRPVITECPHGERVLRDQLEEAGIRVIPVFVVEDPDVVANRYEAREGKACPKNVITRATTILERAEEWAEEYGAFYGSSAEVLNYLKKVKI